MERIISDYLDINYDITQEKINAKYKFFGNIRAKIRYKRLIKSANNIRNATNYRLNKDNLSELFAFIESNHEGKFGVINRVIISDTTGSITGILYKEKSYHCNIIIKDNSKTFDMSGHIIDSNNNKKYFSISSIGLRSNNIEIDPYLKNINEDLLNIISDYLIDYISAFTRKEK